MPRSESTLGSLTIKPVATSLHTRSSFTTLCANFVAARPANPKPIFSPTLDATTSSLLSTITFRKKTGRSAAAALAALVVVLREEAAGVDEALAIDCCCWASFDSSSIILCFEAVSSASFASRVAWYISSSLGVASEPHVEPMSMYGFRAPIT